MVLTMVESSSAFTTMPIFADFGVVDLDTKDTADPQEVSALLLDLVTSACGIDDFSPPTTSGATMVADTAGITSSVFAASALVAALASAISLSL